MSGSFRQDSSALPPWRQEFIDTLTRAPNSYLKHLEAEAERDLAWWRSRIGTPPDEEWPKAVRTMIEALQDRLADLTLERARRS